MATVYKIHPAIGIARVGNSPTEFFIGPERVGEKEIPSGGYKDSQCRVKRQAARFRIFAHHDNGTEEEISDSEADITWNVHLVNKKAANPGRGNTESDADLTIDPGTRSLTGPNQTQLFDSGQINFSGASAVSVPLGEIRSDTKNRLLVLGGFGTANSPLGTDITNFWGNDDWYDDVSDGPVSASLTLRDTGATATVVGAWVIVTPPKFAPQLDSVITLYDRLLQTMVDGGFTSAPASTSYTDDVYPILQRGRDTRWVQSLGMSVHGWEDNVPPAARDAIFNRLTAPEDAIADMPDLLEGTNDGRLTPIQYEHMTRWKDNSATYSDDWSGAPASAQINITADGLTRAALEACVGGAFFPGIEAGGRNDDERPILDTSNFQEAFRLDHTVVRAGDMSYTMALPWQADFYACRDNWWPVPRPNQVIRQGESGYSDWDTGAGNYAQMVANWHALGFVVKQGEQHVEVDRCDVTSIALLTPSLNFVDVPQGPLGMTREHTLAITFEVIAPGSSVELAYAAGGAPVHSQLVVVNDTTDSIGPTAPNAVQTAYLWVVFKTSALGPIPTQTVTVEEVGGSQSWTITIDGNVIPRKTSATVLTLDRSGSMDEDRGDGVSKHISMRQAANIFVDVMLEGDGVGIVSYDETALPIQPVVLLAGGGLSDTNRGDTKDRINGNQLDPAGSTSIGNGIAEARELLNNATQPASGPYDEHALVVLTDGKENRSQFIADVAADINEKTYAIGFGTPQNTSSAALQNVSGNHGGYLLVTGAIGQDSRFRLQKYFLQILAGVSNAEVVLDPDGMLVSNQVHRIPFQLTSADSGVDVILLSSHVGKIDFRLQTPSGQLLEPWRAIEEPGMRFVLSNGVSYYRLVLPTELRENRRDHQGTWHALLRIGGPRLKPTDGSQDGVDRSIRFAPRRPNENLEGSLRRRKLESRAIEIARHEAFTHNDAVTDSTSMLSSATHGRRERGVEFSLLVHAYSSVSMSAELRQSGREPGDQVTLAVSITESGIPIDKGTASVWAEISQPSGAMMRVDLQADGDGRFSAGFKAEKSGVYHCRVRANGETRRNEPYTREQTLTAAAWYGGNSEQPRGRDPIEELKDLLQDRDEQFCELMQCITNSGVLGEEFEKRLKGMGIDIDRLKKCLSRYCESKRKFHSNRNHSAG